MRVVDHARDKLGRSQSSSLKAANLSKCSVVNLSMAIVVCCSKTLLRRVNSVDDLI